MLTIGQSTGFSHVGSKSYISIFLVLIFLHSFSLLPPFILTSLFFRTLECEKNHLCVLRNADFWAHTEFLLESVCSVASSYTFLTVPLGDFEAPHHLCFLPWPYLLLCFALVLLSLSLAISNTKFSILTSIKFPNFHGCNPSFIH